MELTGHETWEGLGPCQPNLIYGHTLIYAGGNYVMASQWQ